MNKILSNHILHFWLVQDTKSRILLCTCQDGRILQLGYELCHKHLRLGKSDFLHYLSSGAYHLCSVLAHSGCSFPGHSHIHTFLTGMFLEASSDLYWNHGNKDIASNCDSMDLKYMGLFWMNKGPRTWCTVSRKYFVYRTSWYVVELDFSEARKSEEVDSWIKNRSSHLEAWAYSWTEAFETGAAKDTIVTLQPSGSGGPLSVISTFSVDAYTVAYREASFGCSETKRRLAC